MRARLFVLAVAVSACASSGNTASTGLSGDPLTGEARQVSANVITEAEIARHSFENAWQAILSLRPTWPRIGAYVNMRRVPQWENLQEVPIGTVKEIRLLSREQARVRFGPEAQAAIQVVTK